MSVNTVKSWASRYWKAEQVATKSCNRKKKVATEKVATKKQAGPGAPKGNVNAVGNHGGAPPGNTNALKHGGWSAVMFGSWSEENRAAIEQCDKSVDVEDLLVQELQLLTARESFLMQRIAKYSEKPTHIQMVHTSKTSRSFSRVDGNAELEARDKERYIEAIDKRSSGGTPPWNKRRHIHHCRSVLSDRRALGKAADRRPAPEGQGHPAACRGAPHEWQRCQ